MGRTKEWIEMDGEAFYRSIRTDEAGCRHFICFTNDRDPEADLIYMEVSEKEYFSWKIEHDRKTYYRKRNHLYEREFVSLGSPAGGTNEKGLTIEDVTGSDDPWTEDLAVSKLQIEELRRAVSLLTRKEQELLEMRFWESMSYQEIANAIGSSVQNVHQRLNRIYKKLEKRLKGK